LLFAQTDGVLAQLDAPLAVLPRWVRTTSESAFFGLAALSLEEEFFAFTTAKFANGADISSHE
jgi:hypothetical protein